MPESTRAAARPGRRAAAWWGLGAVVALGVLAVALVAGGGAGQAALPGLPDAGAVTRWGLPVARLCADLLGVLTVGLTVTAAFLLPASGAPASRTPASGAPASGAPTTGARAAGAPAWQLSAAGHPGGRPGTVLGPHGYLLLRRAGLAAAGWALASAALAGFTLADLLGRPVTRLPGSAVHTFLISVPQGQALAVQVLLAAGVAVACRLVLCRTPAAFTALAALVATLPPALSGHAAAAGDHQLAVTSMALHVVAAALWAGCLVGLLGVRRSDLLAATAARFGRLAAVCLAVLAGTGVLNAVVRLPAADQLLHTGYGGLVLVKAAALLVLGVLGAAGRRAVHAGLAAGRPAALRRLVAGEVLVMAATFAVAVAMSRTAPPEAGQAGTPDPTTDLVGFPMPPAPTPARLVTEVLPDLFFLLLAAAGAGLYLAGVLRLRRNGTPWPVLRTVAWLAGIGVLVAVTAGGVGTYAYLLFSVHMAQHLALSMVVPGLLVLGGPVTLALRALRPAADPAVAGPREWLLAALHSRALRVLGHPVTALAILVASLYGLYFSGLFAVLMRSHVGHVLMLCHFVASGYLYFWMLIGIDPGRRQLPHPVLILVHLASMAFHAFFGVALMQAHGIVAGDWFGLLHPAWRVSLAADQSVAAGIAWSFGEIPAAAAFVVLVRQWITADEREQRRLDRAAARADAAEAGGQPVDDELARYNTYLATLAEQSRHADRR